MNSITATDFALLDSLQSISYTPKARMVESMFRLFLDAELDTENRQNLVRGLSRLGEIAWKHGVLLLSSLTQEKRASTIRVLGQLGTHSYQPSPTEVFLKYAKDSDPRTARAAIVELGKIQGSGLEEELLELWRRPYALPERKVLAEALGKQGSTRALEILNTVRSQEQDSEFLRILSQACLRLERQLSRNHANGRIRGEAKFPEGTNVTLRCRRGVENLLLQEIRGLSLPWKAQVVAPGRVWVQKVRCLRDLYQSRLFIDCAFSEKRALGPSLEQTIIQALTRPKVLQLLRGLTEGDVRYRIHFTTGGHRRALVWRIAEEVLEKVPWLLNDPDQSLWQIEIAETEVRIDMVPKQLDDPRFSYRLDYVPAASHPTLAAALAFVAKIKQSDVVWDPFVGSGSELIEAARFAKCRQLIGSDLDPKALAIAQRNLAQAAVTATLVQADARSYGPTSVSLILTNPPMGRRVQRGQMKTVLTEFLQHARQVLQPGGRLVWISPLPSLHRQQASQLGFKLQFAQIVDMNGFEGEIQAWVKT